MLFYFSLIQGLLALATAKETSAQVANSNDAEVIQIPTRVYGSDIYPVTYRRLQDVAAARARYPGFNHTTTVLKAGTIRREGARPLTCDILMERDVPMTLRDGVTIYTDIFRPVGNETVPAIVAWSPYGKEVGGQWLDDVAGRSGVPLANVSELQKFEGPDPAYWVAQGYAVINPDVRGAYSSEGNITFWGRQLAEDGYDFIEWAATNDWSSGKIAMSGNSWLAVSQWFIAAEQPPHLTAIAPWEGLTDVFRDSSNRGGMPSPGFNEAIITTFAGAGYVEDLPRMSIQNPLMNTYWEDRIAQLDKINVPAYIVASYTNAVHTRGTFDAFRSINSTDKWLRVHNTSEWPDYYQPEHVDDLRRFFDYYLKGENNGWNSTSTVRLAVLDPGSEDTLDRAVTSWPVEGIESKRLYLQSNQTLSEDPLPSEAFVTKNASGEVEFIYRMSELTELIGYTKLRLWVEAVGSNDMELSITVEKKAANGSAFTSVTAGETTSISASQILRVSQRHLSEELSTESEPYLTFDREELLIPGQIVPVDIPLWPIALRFHPDELLVLTVASAAPSSGLYDLGFGTAIVPVPAAGGTFSPGDNVTLLSLGAENSPDYVNAQRVDTPASRNNGTHILHLGGDYDSYLLLPLI